MIRQCALLCLCLAVAYGGAAAPKISAPAGTFVGKTVNTNNGGAYTQFRGIPYAEPPIGKLRFKRTVPKVVKLEGEYDATEFKPFCIQMKSMPWDDNVFGPGQEDCLYLNVYTPTRGSTPSLVDIITPKTLKKVLVFLHGGGNLNSASDFYVPGELVVKGNIIVVTVNYRLGVLGFMSTHSSASPGNYGLWDQLAALTWVRDNIVAFGGDPGGVTLSGADAGGLDVALLTLSPMAKGLFTRAWPMSGATGVDHLPFSSSFEALMTLARNELCLTDDDKDPSTDIEWQKVVECIRSFPETRFGSMDYIGHGLIGPVIDGDLLPKNISDMFTDEEYLTSIGFHRRDYMVSVCHNEGSLYSAMVHYVESKRTPEQKNETPLIDGLLPYVVKKVFGRHRDGEYEHLSLAATLKIKTFYEEHNEINFVEDITADAFFHVPILEYLNAMAKSFGSKPSKAHFLQFKNFPEFVDGPYPGTLHMMDLLYAFDFTDMEVINKIVDFKLNGTKWSRADTDLKTKYQELITSFVNTGTPTVTKGANDKTRVDWPAYTEEGGHYLVFNDTPTIQQHLKADRLEFFTHDIPRIMKEHPGKDVPHHLEDPPNHEPDDEL